MSKKKVLFIFGTRPEAIKLVSVIHMFKSTNLFEIKVCSTGQHREMLNQVLRLFKIHPDFQLSLMTSGQNITDLTTKVLQDTKKIMEDYKPDLVIVQGDTTTAFASSLAAFYSGVKVAHVEAGLRTHDKFTPYPEEMNRMLITRIADFHFPPTPKAHSNLIKEGVNELAISMTGNTGIDALKMIMAILKEDKYKHIESLRQRLKFDEIQKEDKKIILVTSHRRENFGSGMSSIYKALQLISEQEKVQIIFPVHLNPNVKEIMYDNLSHNNNITLLNPLNYEEFIWVMNESYIILTDSGGIQEEAPSLGKPVLVMRNSTERPEAVEVGTVKIVGADTGEIVSQVHELLHNNDAYLKMARAINPYGDGQAAKRIYNYLSEKL
ncbi:MAG: UDP-N-acetylglucosamine 2-epimerase (non-hydrolyzing) [Bacteroidota bacterium]|nr:UDP-N-acetylglucosamine 2-epimerase (non-hydrolyzing) [Bacteroidota bacterium]